MAKIQDLTVKFNEKSDSSSDSSSESSSSTPIELLLEFCLDLLEIDYIKLIELYNDRQRWVIRTDDDDE